MSRNFSVQVPFQIGVEKVQAIVVKYVCTVVAGLPVSKVLTHPNRLEWVQHVQPTTVFTLGERVLF